jgi:endonuclease-3
MKSDRTSRRRKTRRIILALERILGLPRQQGTPPDPLDLLIATILSQNTNDKNSHRAYTLLRRRYSDWASVAAAPLKSIVAAVRSGGMARQKAARIREVLRSVQERYREYDLGSLATRTNADVMTELTSMNGVGVKTASCVLLFSLRRDVFPVDTHVHRICARLGLARNCKTPEQTFKAMAGLVPKGKAYSFHTNLIRFGRKVCRSNRPDCYICPLYNECHYPGKSRIPRRGSSAADHDFMLLDNVQTAASVQRIDS